jgi:hypothetical protein
MLAVCIRMGMFKSSLDTIYLTTPPTQCTTFIELHACIHFSCYQNTCFIEFATWQYLEVPVCLRYDAHVPVLLDNCAQQCHNTSPSTSRLLCQQPKSANEKTKDNHSVSKEPWLRKHGALSLSYTLSVQPALM